MDVLRSRIQMFITDELKTTNREFEKTLGLSNGMIARFLQGTNVGVDVMAKIKEKYPDVDINWFFDENDQSVKVEEPSVSYVSNGNQDAKLMGMISQIVETNRILANSNLTLSESNRTLSNTNAQLVDKILA